MAQMVHEEQFWSERYQQHTTPWDAGAATPPLTNYFDQLKDKNLQILIPGAGNGHEAEYLWKKGFTNVFVLDISALPLKNLKLRVPEFPKDQLLHLNFFNLDQNFDLIVEQTFFCALQPSLRNDYVTKCSQLLKPYAKLVGVLFDDPLYEDHPPYGGNKELYMQLFSKALKVDKMERCYNSIPPRQGRELFFQCSRLA